MSAPFNNLESRYLAFKWKDIEEYLSDAEQRTLAAIAYKVFAARVSAGRGELLCLCIEHDWPEFPPALNALTTRIDKEAGNQPDTSSRLAFSQAGDGSIEIYACQTGTQLVLPAADVPLLIHGLQSYPDPAAPEKPCVDLSTVGRRAIPRRMSVWINHRHYICPYCKRKFARKVRHDTALKASAARHVYACYEGRLFAAGYVALSDRIAPAAEASQKMLTRLRKSVRRAQ